MVIQNEKALGAPPPQGPFPSLLRHQAFGAATTDILSVWDPSPWASFLPPAVVNYGPWLE